MDWGTLAGTAVGAVLGIGATLLAERSRWNRESADRRRTVKQQLYAEYLGALSLTTHRLRDLRRNAGLSREERMERAGEVLGSANAYNLRYQMHIIAPEELAVLADQAFHRLRDLRDHLDGADPLADSRWAPAQAAMTDVIEALTTSMRADLAAG